MSPGAPARPVPAGPGARAVHLVAGTALLLVVAALWAPLGLRVGPTFEDWKALYWSEAWGGIPVMFGNRPLVFAPYTLAHLTGQPLLALNLMQAGAMLAKGLLVYGMVRRLVPAGAALGLLAGVLAVVYPADTGLFTLRKVMLHLAVALDLLAIHLLLSLARPLRWWRLAVLVAAQALSVSLDIPSVPVLLAAPALLLWRERRVSARLGAVIAAWSVVPVAALAAHAWYALGRASYESSVLATSGLGPGPGRALAQLAGRTVRAYHRHFVGGWVDAVATLAGAGPDAAVALGAAAAVALALWWTAGGDGPRPPGRSRLELAGLALAAMPVGFLLFLPTRWILTGWRVFFHSSIGAAVVVAVLVEALAVAGRGPRRALLAVAGGGLVAVALTASLAQHRGYAEQSLRQQRQAAAIIRDAPGLAEGTLVLLLDRPPYPGRRAWTPPCALATECLTMILRYVYGRPDVEAVFCSPGHEPSSPWRERCRFERDELIVTYLDPWAPGQVTRRAPYDRLVAWESTAAGVRLLPDLAADHPDGGTPAYRPAARLGAGTPLPPRVRTAFSRWPP